MDEIYIKKLITDTSQKVSTVITNELKEVFDFNKYLLIETLIKVHMFSLTVELQALYEIRPSMHDDIENFLEKLNEFLSGFFENDEIKH